LAPGAGRFLIVPLFALILIGLLLGLHLASVNGLLVGLILGLLVLFAFFAWFFRDPERPVGPNIVSAADGRVKAVERARDRWRVSVFMNVTDVHVNRFPLGGRVERIEDSGSGFRPAFAEDAAHNAQRTYHLATSLGPVEIIQMTGILARRLVSFVGPGDERPKGSRLGMILLGSRVDVLLPLDRVRVLVRPGDRVRAGVTSIGEEVGS
jgi:phosphatidylserine decarboxylase